MRVRVCVLAWERVQCTDHLCSVGALELPKEILDGIAVAAAAIVVVGARGVRRLLIAVVVARACAVLVRGVRFRLAGVPRRTAVRGREYDVVRCSPEMFCFSRLH